MASVDKMNEQMLIIGHQIRETEHHLAVARRRRRAANVLLLVGPGLALLLYLMFWVRGLPLPVKLAVSIPGVPIASVLCIASFVMKRYPGGPSTGRYRDRKREGQLELDVAQLRDARKLLVLRSDIPTNVRRTSYKEDAYADVEHLRTESNGYRRINNVFQGVLIIGSLAATGASGLLGALPFMRWVILGVTFVVGISSGFMGYFKYKERGFYLQQTADSIEYEWEAFEVGVGRYKRIQTEDDRLGEFVEEVHRLKAEQKKRQQNLDQPPEVRTSNE